MPIFISSGRASPEKGIDLVLKAISKLKAKFGFEPIHFFHFGDGPELSNGFLFHKNLV